MTHLKQRFDIFICGGSQHVSLLEPLLARLLPYGTVHLASSFLSDHDIGRLHGRYDVLHRPAHSLDGYANFELFCIKDVYRLAAAPYFIKLDADVTLADDWIQYVEACITAHPQAVLMGPWKGDVDIDVELSGAPIRRQLRRDVRVTRGLKVIGGFCVARTAFFKERIDLLEIIHEGVLSAERGDTAVRGRVGKHGSPQRGHAAQPRRPRRGRLGSAARHRQRRANRPQSLVFPPCHTRSTSCIAAIRYSFSRPERVCAASTSAAWTARSRSGSTGSSSTTIRRSSSSWT
jgi:hypothetical protein